MINASINEIPKVSSTIMDTSLKKSPTLPSKKKNVEKANIVVMMARPLRWSLRDALRGMYSPAVFFLFAATLPILRPLLGHHSYKSNALEP